MQGLVFWGQFVADVCGQFLQVLLRGSEVATVQGDEGIRFARDGVAQVAAFQLDDAQGVRRVILQGLQGAGEDFDSVAALQVDFYTGVTAFEATHVQVVALPSEGFVLQRQGVAAVDGTGAADAEFAFVFVVKVEQDAAFQPARLYFLRAFEADFFTGGEKGFQRRVAEAFIRQYGQNHRRANAVISAKGGAISMNPVAIHDGADRVFAEIVAGIFVFLRHHVEVRLQDDARLILAPRACCFTHQDVAARIAFRFEAEAPRFVEDVLFDGFFLVCGAGNLCQLVKVLPNRTGLKFGYVHDSSFLCVGRECQRRRAFSGRALMLPRKRCLSLSYQRCLLFSSSCSSWWLCRWARM